ncbi:toprim domain-containing protein [Candidatus Parcubacteria bacterium]|nr:toprim domain-containing protein [Candidatus Parcubacteria bacterium]
MNSIQKLTEYFSEFPGIGPRQARRFVYYLLTRNQDSLHELTHLIQDLKKDIKVCQSCFRFFQDAKQHPVCSICESTSRDHTVRMIVSRDTDLESIEKTKSFNGLYFVLGGTVPILEKNPESRVRSKELLKMIEHEAEKELKEVILAMNATPEGENTGEYVEHLLKPLAEKHTLKISHLGKGISTGTELEYSDADTLKNALKNRY